MPIACPNCGTWASDTDNFCKKCGLDLKPLRSSNVQAPNIPSANLSLGPSLDDMKKAVELQSRTDRIISPIWIVVPVLSFFLSIIGLVLTIISIENFMAALNASIVTGSAVATLTIPGFTYLELASLALLIALLYLFYILIKRRNLHFEREYRFFYDISFVLKNLAATRGMGANQDLQRNLRDIDSELTTIHNTKRDRSAILWIILLFVPIVDVFAYFYIFYFLMKDFEEHEAMEDWLISSVSRALASLGFNFAFSRESNSSGRFPNRNFWLYLVLDLITLGAFGIYWIYLLIKDPNNHFVTEVQIENRILSTVISTSQV